MMMYGQLPDTRKRDKMNDEIVIAQSDCTEQDNPGLLVKVIGTKTCICVKYAHAEGDEGNLSVDWDDVLKHAPKSVMLKELWGRIQTHKDGTPRHQKRGYRCIPKGCTICGGDLFQMHFPFGPKTLTCLECNEKITYNREADLKDFPPSQWI
jgi:hypothetical protein